MIPFNCLGSVFKILGSFVYPARARKDLADAVALLKEKKAVLDIGAGTGILTKFVRRARTDLTHFCLDPARGMLKHAPSFAEKIAGKAEALPFRDNTFSAVFIGDALHHLDNQSRAFAEMRRCLDCEGFIYIFDINPEKLVGHIIYRLETLFGEPAAFLNPGELHRMLADQGYSVKTCDYGWRYAVFASSAGQ